jgi:hypothetical protein
MFGNDLSTLYFDQVVIGSNDNTDLMSDIGADKVQLQAHLNLLKMHEPQYQFYATINCHCVLNEFG